MEGNSKYIGFSGLKDQVVTLLRRLRSIMYPEIFEECPCTATTVIESSLEAEKILNEIIPWVKPDADTPTITNDILEGLDGIRDILDTDIQAAYDGDPAAKDKTEIMLAYPGFEAVSIFRIAHMIYKMEIPYIPRIMTELAHSHTGIDIHPGATIGRYFFIDHGTGVVIGETTVIGEHVKLYQGVTLGAKSFPIGEDGNRRLIVQKPVIAEIAEHAYTGSEIKPEPTVTIGSITLTKGTDYVYSYTNNTNVGTATVRVTFQGTYSSLGYVEKEFTILPSTVMISVTGSGTVTCGDRSATDGTSFGVMSEKGA